MCIPTSRWGLPRRQQKVAIIFRQGWLQDKAFSHPFLLPREEQTAQPLPHGCWFRSMKCHKTSGVTGGELLNILPISFPEKKRIIASNSLGCLRINILSVTRGQDTAVMGTMLKLPLPFHEQVLTMYRCTLLCSYPLLFRQWRRKTYHQNDYCQTCDVFFFHEI